MQPNESDLSVQHARQVDPQKHTMAESHFLSYIGREKFFDCDFRIAGKKFSEDQKALLETAFLENRRIRVFGNFRPTLNDKNEWVLPLELAKIAASEHLALDGVPLEHNHEKQKQFNKHRAAFLKMRNEVSGVEASQIGNAGLIPFQVWVVAFPSPELVEQIAQLIQAILDDFERKHFEGKRQRTISQPSLVAPIVDFHLDTDVAKQISRTTNFEKGLCTYIRHGDVIAFGNVEKLVPGLLSLGFAQKFLNWVKFGRGDMFEVQTFVHPTSHSRLVLLGITECFWGSASARFVEAMLLAGARHILYCSKAGGLDTLDQLHKTRTPQHFSIFRNERGQIAEELAGAAVLDVAVERLARQFDITASGTNITVPTVIGETQEQRDRLKESGLSTVDNEDGHIAAAIAIFNKRNHGDHAIFFPVHFITDYLRQPHEQATKNQHHLGAEAPIIALEKLAAFEKIGALFGTYSALYGLREYTLVGKDAHDLQGTSVAAMKCQTSGPLLEFVREFTEAGLMREAGNALCGSRNLSEQDPSTLVALAYLCQKHGYVDDAFHILSTPSCEIDKLEDPENKIRAAVVQVKLASQVGLWDSVIAKSAKLLDAFEDISETDRKKFVPMLSAATNRLKLAQVVFDQGDTCSTNSQDMETKAASRTNCALQLSRLETQSGSYMPREDDTSEPMGDKEHRNNSNLFFALILRLRTDESFKTDFLDGLSQVRKCFYAVKAAENSAPVYRADANKSVLTTLFTEAAYLLMGDSAHQARGKARLVAAH